MNNPLRITRITLAAVVGIPFLLFCGYTFLSAGFFSGPSEKECVKIAERFLGCKLGNQQEGFYLNISKDGVKSVGIDSIFLHDITMDGVPEVWLLTEGCEADRMVLVYSLSDWNKELYQDTAGHSLFFMLAMAMSLDNGLIWGIPLGIGFGGMEIRWYWRRFLRKIPPATTRSHLSLCH